MIETATFPHCTAKSLGIEIAPKDSEPETIALATSLMASIDAYFNDFADTDGKCPACGAALGGFFGSFSCGLCHGEGTCRCGYPCRAYHRPKDVDGKEIFDGALQSVLPYHTEFVEREKEVRR